MNIIYNTPVYGKTVQHGQVYGDSWREVSVMTLHDGMLIRQDEKKMGRNNLEADLRMKYEADTFIDG